MRVHPDPDRQRRAAARARAAADERDFHARQAEAAKAKVDWICKTWNLDPVTFKPKELSSGTTDAPGGRS